MTENRAAASRIGYMDGLRAAAMVGVILIHVCAKAATALAADGQALGVSWQLANLLDALGRFAVPAYLMVTGGLLLGIQSILAQQHGVLAGIYRIGGAAGFRRPGASNQGFPRHQGPGGIVDQHHILGIALLQHGGKAPVAGGLPGCPARHHPPQLGIAFRRNQSPGLLQMLRVAYQIIAVHQGTVLKGLKGMEQNWFFSEG